LGLLDAGRDRKLPDRLVGGEGGVGPEEPVGTNLADGEDLVGASSPSHGLASLDHILFIPLPAIKVNPAKSMC